MKRSVKLFVIACAVVAAAAGGGAFLVGGNSSKDAHAGVYSGHYYTTFVGSSGKTYYHWMWGTFMNPGYDPAECAYTATKPTGTHKGEAWTDNGAYTNSTSGTAQNKMDANGVVSYHRQRPDGVWEDCVENNANAPSSGGAADTPGANFVTSGYQTP